MDYEVWLHRRHPMPDYVHSGGYVSLMAFDEWKPATPADIAAAHPKCGTCAYMRFDTGIVNTVCHKVNAVTWNTVVRTSTDYCPHHSEVSK